MMKNGIVWSKGTHPDLQWARPLALQLIADNALKQLRDEFNNQKLFIGNTCFVCNKPSKVRHHVILLKNGDTNSRDNIVALCLECHQLIHDWRLDKTIQ